MRFLVFALALSFAAAAPRGLPRHHRGHHKIAGGTDASPGEFPYQLSFQEVKLDTTFHFCGASIYDEGTAITAGHCVFGEDQDYDNPSNLRVVAGEHNLAIEEGNEQAVDVAKIILHEDYSSYSVANDIALLKFSSLLTFNKYVSGVALPEPSESFVGTAIVSGWGTDKYYLGETPDTLQKVEVPVVSDEECRIGYGDGAIFDSNICAGEEGKGSCFGDSGGPLTCNGKLCGIVSWGDGCGLEGYPGVYTEVSYFVDWITTNSA